MSQDNVERLLGWMITASKREGAMASESICLNCDHQSKPEKITKGNMLVEVILWLFFIVPGIIYSIWRLRSKQEVCPKCNEINMVPQGLHRAKILVAEFS
jgi:hypothetical protein